MKSYKISIVSHEEDPEYEKKRSDWLTRREERSRGFRGPHDDLNDSPPTPTKGVTVLETVLTEEQWQKAQESILSTFK